MKGRTKHYRDIVYMYTYLGLTSGII